MRRRGLLWLLAIAAFVLLPAIGPAVPAAVAKAVMAGCDHPPVPPCPDAGSAKHATGQCCPSMYESIAVLAPGLDGLRDVPRSFALTTAVRLMGLSPHQDPPPPRV